MKPRFNPGDVVRFKVEPTRVAIVACVRPHSVVLHSPTGRVVVLHNQIEIASL